MSTEQILTNFINLNEEQKLAVINKLENNKETPAVILTGLRWLYEMSKTSTVDAMYDLVNEGK